MRQFDAGELARRVDEVLFYVWDPIGVSDEPYARYEYASYVPEVLRLVEQNDDPAPVSLHLAQIERDYMGMTPDKKRCDDTAALLLEHKKALRDGCA